MEEQKKGNIVRGIGGYYTIREENGMEYTLRARGRFRKEHITPLVGDSVLFTPGEGEKHGWIDEILPRKSECLRPPVANIELELLVMAPTPQPDFLLIDRLLIRALQGEIEPLIVVNKIDMDPSMEERVRAQYSPAGIQVMAVSAAEKTGVEELASRMRGRICCVAGQSAVGKSTLLNVLCGLDLKTGGLSEKIQRGKHTTRHAELLEANGLRVLDTPGFSLLTLEDEPMPPESLLQWYPEFRVYEGKCRFMPCMHDREPDCAVREAVQKGEIHQLRYERYRELLKEMREEWTTRYKRKNEYGGSKV